MVKKKTLWECCSRECISERQRAAWSFLFTYGIGLIAHAFGFLNLYPSGDLMVGLFYVNLSGNQLSIGRVLAPMYHQLTATMVFTPWTVGLLSLLWIALSVWLVTIIFDIRSIWQILTVAGVFVTNRTVTALIATYEMDLGADMLALLSAVFAVFCWHRFLQGKKKSYLFMGALSLMVSMGLYQSYVAVAVTLIMCRSLLRLLDQEDSRQVCKDGIYGIVMFLVGGGLYYVLINTVCNYSQVELAEGDYNNVTNLWNNTEPFFQRICACYKQVFSYFTDNVVSCYPHSVMLCIHLLLGFGCFFLIFFIIRDRKITGMTAWLLLALLVVLLPIGINLIRLMNTVVHDLVVFAVWLVYLFPLFLWKFCLEKKIRIPGGGIPGVLLSLLLCLVIVSNVQTANTAYVYKKLEYDSTVSLMTNVLYEIEQQEGYVEGETPVVFIGWPGEALVSLPNKENIMMMEGMAANSPAGWVYRWFNLAMQRNVNFQVAAAELTDSELVQNMPSYPQKGSIVLVDGTVG